MTSRLFPYDKFYFKQFNFKLTPQSVTQVYRSIRRFDFVEEKKDAVILK